MVFIPLAFLTGVAGVFFRALALTMVVLAVVAARFVLAVAEDVSADNFYDRMQEY